MRKRGDNLTDNVDTRQAQARDQVSDSAIRRAIKKIPGAVRLNSSLLRLVAATRPRLGTLKHYPPRTMRDLPRPRTRNPQVTLPSIAIVVPSYNHGRFLERTLRSVLDQNYPYLDLRVQDGASEDQTTSVLAAWEDKLSGWKSVPDRGQANALNRGFALSRGEIMAWLNADDMLLPGALESVGEFFLRHPEVDVAYGNRLLIDENDMEIGCWILPKHSNAVLSWADFVPQETLFWRRRIWERTGAQIDESFQFAMDWDLLVRFRDAGAKISHIDRFLGAFRIHEQQKTSAAISDVGYAEMDRIRKRCLGRVPTLPEIRRAVAPYMVRHVLRHMSHQITGR